MRTGHHTTRCCWDQQTEQHLQLGTLQQAALMLQLIQQLQLLLLLLQVCCLLLLLLLVVLTQVLTRVFPEPRAQSQSSRGRRCCLAQSH